MLLANAGTPLLWGLAMHLLFGNLVIGLAEGLLLWCFRPKSRWQSCLAMVVANYASAWFGVFALSSANAFAGSLGLAALKPFFWAMVVVSYLFTLVVEFPFIYWELPRGRGRWRRAAKASVIIQGVSYAVLFGLYAPLASVSFLRTPVVSVDDLELPSGVEVQYLSEEDYAVYAGDLRTREWRILPPDDPRCAVTNASHRSYGEAARLGSATNSAWKVRTGIWAGEGLRCTDGRTGEVVELALETPLLTRNARSASLLPEDVVLFGFGGQVCLFDLKTRRLAPLVRGRAPAATLKRGRPAQTDNRGNVDG